MMATTHEQLNELQKIRSLMEKSSRFIGLSGLSGIAAGLCALVGASVTYIYVGARPFEFETTYQNPYFERALTASKWGMHHTTFFIVVASLTILSAVGFGILFTTRHARKKGQSIWDASARRLLVSLFVPLSAGGLFCLAMLFHGSIGYLAPATLVFYGLALVNGSKYTLDDVYYLGLTEIGLGIVAMFLLRYGLEFWVIGFGFLHIVYGAMMYFKYEKKQNI
jgi:hypothetical protein